MDWLELSASVPVEHVEMLCTALSELVPGGCSIEDPVALLGPEEGVRREPWRPSTVRAYLPVDTHLDERCASAHAVAAAPPFELRLTERPVREEDWANSWKEFFHVERIGSRLVVRPTWREFEPAPNDIVLHLDPGMAFGTGQHETTRMCLAAVEELVDRDVRVLDLGCGSGILAIASARLGATLVDAVDIEPVAVEATAANAARNGLGQIVHAAEGSLDQRWPFGDLPVDRYDLVLANIHASAGIALAPAIRAALRPGGALVASGIITSRLDRVLAALVEAGFGALDLRAEGEWRTVIARIGSDGSPQSTQS